MQYVIYDTNEYVRMVGDSNKPFNQIEESVARLHNCEQRLSLVPILNTTVAFELIKHLASNDPNELNLYIRACYALAIHCRPSFPIMTKNPIASYIENEFQKQLVSIDYLIKFLQEMINNPTPQTIAANSKLIERVDNYLYNVGINYLADLQRLRPQFQTQDDQRKWMLQIVNTKDYLQYRATSFLESLVVACREVDSRKVITANTLRKFVQEHPTYIEIWREFDKKYIEGGYNLQKLKTANTFWDAEICYHLGTTVNNHKVYIVTEENMLHRAAKKAHQSNWMLKINQVHTFNKIRFYFRNFLALIQKPWWTIIRTQKN